MSTQDLVIIKPSISAIAPSSEGGCLSSAMLRAKIDLRQPSFLLRPRTVTATVSSQGLKNTQFPRFGAEINLHIIRICGRHAEIRAQAFSAVLDHVVSMRDRERARDGSVNVLSQRTLRVFSDHKQETDSSTKGLVCLSRN